MGAKQARSNKAAALLAAETRRIPTAPGGSLRLCLGYPNSYAVGMANLGFQTLLNLASGQGFALDRVFVAEKLEVGGAVDRGAESRGLESGWPLSRFDALILSVAFEPDYVGLIELLRQAQIPPLAEQRNERDPLVIAGGLAPTLNPEPLSPFCDLIGIGDADSLLPPLWELLRQHLPREALLQAAAALPGWLVPGLGRPPVTRQQAPLLRPNYPAILAPSAAFARHVDVEISRGCRWRCRFCASGFVVQPYRELSLEQLREALLWGVAKRGRVGLVGTDVSDHSALEAISELVWQRGGEVALPSLRVERLARRSGQAARVLRRQPPRTLTLAVESASESLRCALGKRLSEERLLRAVAHARELGVNRLKLYFLVGVPGEDFSEVEAIVPLARRLAALGPPGGLSLSVNGLVPKPGTPLQWEAPPERRYLRRARRTLRALPGEGIELTFESPDWTRWQALLSLGDRQLSTYLLEAAIHGWRIALARAEKEQPLLQGTGRAVGSALPWDHVKHGLPREVLRRERERLLARRYVPPGRL